MFRIFYLNITKEDAEHEDFIEVFTEIFSKRVEFPFTCPLLLKEHSFQDDFYKYFIRDSLINYQRFYGKHILKV